MLQSSQRKYEKLLHYYANEEQINKNEEKMEG